jgi:hypothetical protein
MLLRCTQRLLKGSGIAPDPDPPVPASPLGEWYANAVPLRFAGRWVVLYVNAATLVAVIVPGRSLRRTLDGFRARAVALLRRIGMPDAWIEEHARELEHAAVARTASRPMLGFMNDMARFIHFQAEEVTSFAELDLVRLEDFIADTPYNAGRPNVRWPETDLRALAGLPRIVRP